MGFSLTIPRRRPIWVKRFQQLPLIVFLLKQHYVCTDCEDQILACKEVLQRRIDSKTTLVEKLDISLQEDIRQLFAEVEKVRVDCTQDWLISADTDRAQAVEALATLHEHLTELQAKAQEYKKYQREFKVFDINVLPN